jgi:zinc transport system substrate-binding protein
VINAKQNEAGIKTIVVTTTHIGAIAKEIGKDKVRLATLVPGGMCPGHFDIAPGMAEEMAKADLFIRHDWGKWIEGFLDGIKSGSLHKTVVATEGNWMIPEVNIKAAQEITGILMSFDAKNILYYKDNLERYKKKIMAESAQIRKIFKKHKGKKVICSEHQKDFLVWLGLNVVKAYGRAEDQNIKEMADTISIAKKERIALVVDNLQSGPKAGLRIAEDLKVPQVTLSNFPETDSYLETLRKNVRLIEQGLE